MDTESIVAVIIAFCLLILVIFAYRRFQNNSLLDYDENENDDENE